MALDPFFKNCPNNLANVLELGVRDRVRVDRWARCLDLESLSRRLPDLRGVGDLEYERWPLVAGELCLRCRRRALREFLCFSRGRPTSATGSVSEDERERCMPRTGGSRFDLRDSPLMCEGDLEVERRCLVAGDRPLGRRRSGLCEPSLDLLEVERDDVRRSLFGGRCLLDRLPCEPSFDSELPLSELQSEGEFEDELAADDEVDDERLSEEELVSERRLLLARPISVR